MLFRFPTLIVLVSSVLISTAIRPANSAEIVSLSAEMWDQFVPQGKEVDAIYGDIVLRNDKIVAVIGHPLPTRNANMTVHGVAGQLIDLTRRDRQSDQLSAFYAGASRDSFGRTQMMEVSVESDFEGEAEKGPGGFRIDKTRRGKQITLSFVAQARPGSPKATLRYLLNDGEDFLQLETIYKNSSDKMQTVELSDSIRADRTFDFGIVEDTNLFWAYDQWFGQAYGVVAEGYEVKHVAGRAPLIEYWKDGAKTVSLEPGAEFVLRRKVFPAADRLQIRDIANSLAGIKSRKNTVKIFDPAGPVNDAKVTITDGQKIYGSARTFEEGQLSFAIPDGKYAMTVKALGRPDKVVALTADQTYYEIELESCGYVVGEITDKNGGPIPCKVAFHGIDGTESPYFGPDSGAVTVENLHYCHSGKFRQAIGPGKYEVIISYGPEYDAVFRTIEVERGKETEVAATLKRVVDSTGWISSDFHSHSSPSGDNTGSQLGRVLNLLCENLDFAPCTEHNRIDTYAPHLKRLGVEHIFATCTGMELTGSPLPVNHQNAFPLNHKPRMQDGGAPLTDANPVVQIERLALWDDNSDKLVQGNHPNLVQILGDKNTDGKPDGGFREMLGFMDVVEVHPPETILVPPGTDQFKALRRNPIFHWLQMLNMGYRISGVVNTDAHYNFHESGWLRNWIKSPTDDPAKIQTMDVVHAAERGNLVMSNGPFLQVTLATDGDGDKSRGGPGDDVAAPTGNAELTVHVQCANWIDVNRVQVFLNGRMEPTLNFTRRTTPDRFADGVVKFKATLPLELKSDTHIIVAVAGEGLQLGRVMGPRWGEHMPIAVSNPIFVNVDGGGFKPNGDLLGVPLPVVDE